MLEKRRSQRIPTGIHLHICDLYRQDAFGIHHLEVPIVLTDISEHGVGFLSKSILPPQYQFHACLNLGAASGFLVTLDIVRCTAAEQDQYLYGCEFVDLEESLRTSIRQYINANLADAPVTALAAEFPRRPPQGCIMFE